MYRRQSTVQSAKSTTSPPYPNGFPSASYPSAALTPAFPSSSKQSFGVDTPSPDELFSRYSVSEVKAIQHRLRNDADIKQEELRLMVGERYRDLLQASSSIISMASSSRRVLDAIEESRGAIIAQEEPPLPSRATTFGGVNDRHLHTLQLLSAHVKVLLDAPEHLWRLIERKKYLSAAWLFLFTRVVHRALVQQDDQDEDSWGKVGIDVQLEFPLVQRQWDEVSSFRSQIIHKATLSLREIGLPAEGVCATLVTLHLLDSRPLSETFSALLTQRTKALAPLVSWKIDSILSHSANGRAGPHSLDPSPTKPYLAKEILQANQKALAAIIDTVHTSRQVFQIPSTQQLSLISFALHSIQDDFTPDSSHSQNASELVPTTHSLLTNSSSSAHFLLLPPSLQAYKPYIDLTSPSLMYSQTDFRQIIQDWMLKSLKSWRESSSNWIVHLAKVIEVWTLRTSLRQSINDSELDSSEKSQLVDILNGLCHDRIVAIWKATLARAQDVFKSELASFLSNLKEQITPRASFQAPPPPTTSQPSKVHNPAPFHQYQSSLKKQLLGRTAQLNAVLSTLEQCARLIQHDLSIVLSDESEGGASFGKSVTEAYQPLAESTSDAIVATLEREGEDALKHAETPSLVGVANTSDELRSSSIFLSHIGCRKPALDKLRVRLDSLFDKVVQRWREETVTRIVRVSCSRSSSFHRQALGPSPRCFQSLLSLSDALRELGVGQQSHRHEPVIQASLRALIMSHLSGQPDEPEEQSLHDLAFLKAISSRYGPEWQETTQAIADKLKSQDSSKLQELEQTASEFLVRTQTLLSLLLPCASQIRSLAASMSSSKDSQFLLFGNPSSSKQEYQPALELAKTGSRFGLLLVSSVEN